MEAYHKVITDDDTRDEVVAHLDKGIQDLHCEAILNLLPLQRRHAIHRGHVLMIAGVSTFLSGGWLIAYFLLKYFNISLLQLMGVPDRWWHVVLIPVTFWFVVFGSFLALKILMFQQEISTSLSSSGIASIHDIEKHARSVEAGFQSNAKLAVHLMEQLEQEKRNASTLLVENRELGWQLHLMTRLTSDTFWTLDRNGRIKTVGQAVCDIVGLPASSLLGMELINLLAKGEQSKVQAFLSRVRQGNDVEILETFFQRKDGNKTQVRLSAIATQDADLGERRIHGTMVEITRQKELEDAVLDNLSVLIDVEDRPAFLTTTATMDGILGCQLEGVIQETEKAARQISGFASSLDQSMTDLMQVLTAANIRTSELGKSSQQIIDEDQQAIQDLKNFIAHAEDRQKEGRERVRAAMDQVRGLKHLVEIVLEVSEYTTVLALNARIVAARAGTHGHKFTVVANEVRKLAQQTREAAHKIKEGITHAAATVEAVLSDRLDGGQGQYEETLLHKSAEQMVRLGEHYRNLVSFNEGTMRQISEWNDQMTDKVILLVGGAQFQDIVRQQVEQVVNALNRRKAHADAIVEKLRHPTKQIALSQLSAEDLFQDYVMESQRQVHDQAMGAGGKKQESLLPMVELF